METPLDEQEIDTWNKIFKKFPLEVISILENLSVLMVCIAALMDTQTVYSEAESVEQLKKLDKKEKCFAVWTFLLNEALERMYSARLLLFTGHQSRCLSCLRDAFECLRWADICLKDEYQTDCWLRGKEITIKRSHAFPDLLSPKVNSKIQNVLSTEGTHPYVKACLISIHSPQDEESPQSQAVIQRSIVAFLSILDTAIGYTLTTMPFIREKVIINKDMILRMKDCYDRNVGSLRDAGFL